MKPLTLFTVFILYAFQCIHAQELGLTYVTSAKLPTEIKHAGDGRLFIVEQGGKIRILEVTGTLQTLPFLDITSRVLSGGEQGLLGLAFDPSFNTNGFFYVNYTRQPDGATVISRFKVNGNPNHCDPSTEQPLLTIYQPYPNHNGGHIAFGPDGYLYIGMGDGGSAGDPENRAQNLDSLLGKMLRIDVSNSSVSYQIPSGNPLVGKNGRDEIWDYGLRNPWGWSFDRLTGDLWIADVGQDMVEEINLEHPQSGNRNYGWRCYEGNSAYNNAGCGPTSDFVFPIYTYYHLDGNCSITGGYRYRGKQYPNLSGKYFYADFCTGIIQYLTETSQDVFTNTMSNARVTGITSFGEDMNGELYVASSEAVYKIIDSSTPTGLSELNTFKELLFYPNADQSIYTLEFKNELAQQLHISITDVMGQTLFETSQYVSQGEQKLPIALNHATKGVYFLNLKTENDLLVKKFVSK